MKEVAFQIFDLLLMIVIVYRSWCKKEQFIIKLEVSQCSHVPIMTHNYYTLHLMVVIIKFGGLLVLSLHCDKGRG